VTPLEWWSTYLLGAGTAVLCGRVFRWLRLHERDATPDEFEQMRKALRHGPRAQ
jgi:hypothetical protein